MEKCAVGIRGLGLWLVAVASFATKSPCHATLPLYGDPIIYARTGVTSFNLPNGSSLASPTLAINDQRNLAIDVNVVGGSSTPGVFYGSLSGSSASGDIVASATDTITGDPQLNADGDAVYAVGFDDNPFVYEPTLMSASAINYPLGVTGSSNLVLTDIDQLGARLDFGFTGDVIGTFDKQSAGLPALQLYAADNGVDASSPYSFIYTPDTSSFGGPVGGPVGAPRIASKVSTVAGFDFEEIRIFDADGTSRLVANETEIDPMSPFSELVTNSVAISNNGRWVAFQATDTSGASGIYKYNDDSGMIHQVAEVGLDGVATIDIFSPDVNDDGLVVFRGDDTSGRSSVFIGNGTEVWRVGGEGDELLTDVGERRLGRRDMDFSQSGAPRINNRGDVAFIFQYFDPANASSVADGSLALLAPAFRSGDFGDGTFDCLDIDQIIAAIANGDDNPVFDLNIDGVVNLEDRDVWLAQAGSANLLSGAPYLLGDANLDGTVDGADFLIWNANKFSPTSAWCSADFNADGLTDGADFLIWNANKFLSADGGALVVVPEPAPWVLSIWTVGLLKLRASRRTRSTQR